LIIFINSFGTNKIEETDILKYIQDNYDLTPKGIIDKLDLLNVKYSDTSVYGHFGKYNLNWEK